jgi:hypothetical protein
MLFHRVDHRLLSVHVIGTEARELVHIGQAIIGSNGGLDYFLKTVFNYPTLAECTRLRPLMPITNSAWIRNLQRLEANTNSRQLPDHTPSSI